MRQTMPFILATAGHVDHGKSALVRALTGTDPDRLPEERARGLTIQLGFSSLQLPMSGDGGRIATVGVVDVPGHEDFVKNMVAGVGSVDLALLAVAADDGWMPQTEEHLQILLYLGVQRGVVALTKADLVPDTAPLVARLRQHLQDTPLATAPIVPTSTRDERSLDALGEALSQELGRCEPPRDIEKPRLPLDRVFSLPGVGTIVTGTLVDGVLKQGQSVVLQPTAAPARIRAIQVHGHTVEAALPGSRVALHLAGVRPGGGDTSTDETVLRGHTVTLPGIGCPGETIDALVRRLDRPADRFGPGPGRLPPLRNGARVHVHLGATAIPARIHLAETSELGAGQACLAQLRLERPAFALGGDRLVIRDWSGRHTLAGGIILDPIATRQGWKEPERLAVLRERAEAPEAPDVWVRSDLARRHFVPRSEMMAMAGFAVKDVKAAIQRLVQAGDVVGVGDLLFHAPFWHDLCQRATQAIDHFHQQHPERPGLPLTEVRAALGADASPAVCEGVIDVLCSDGFRRHEASILRASHQPRLPPRLAPAGERLRQRLAADPLNPPSRQQLAPDPLSEQALRFLIINGEVRELTSQCVIAGSALDHATAQVRQFIATRGPASVSHLKQHLGSSRRIMIPLLEHLDHTGITRRDGDVRTLADA